MFFFFLHYSWPSVNKDVITIIYRDWKSFLNFRNVFENSRQAYQTFLTLPRILNILLVCLLNIYIFDDIFLDPLPLEHRHVVIP